MDKYSLFFFFLFPRLPLDTGIYFLHLSGIRRMFIVFLVFFLWQELPEGYGLQSGVYGYTPVTLKLATLRNPIPYLPS
jgi:hypothetical protein